MIIWKRRSEIGRIGSAIAGTVLSKIRFDGDFSLLQILFEKREKVHYQPKKRRKGKMESERRKSSFFMCIPCVYQMHGMKRTYLVNPGKSLVFSRKNHLTRPEACNIISQYDMSQEDVGTKAPEQAFHDIVNLNYMIKQEVNQ